MNRTHASRLHQLARPWWLTLCLVLGACTALPDKPVRSAVYDFGPGARTNPVAAGADSAPAPIELGAVDATTALDSTALLYRLAYADAQRLQPYALARWSMPPAQLLHQRLRESLGRQQRVLTEGDGLDAGVRATRSLRLELQEFSQVFDAPDTSVGLVRLHASVVSVTTEGGRLLAQRSFVAQRPAPSPDAGGGVHALTAASDAVVSDIARWLNTLQ